MPGSLGTYLWVQKEKKENILGGLIEMAMFEYKNKKD